MTAFQDFLRANQHLHRELAPAGRRGVAVIDGHQGHVFYLYSVVKVGMIFAHLQGLEPVPYPSPRSGAKQRAILRSLSARCIPARLAFFSCALRRLPATLLQVARLRTKEDVVGLQIGGARIGTYIFDAIYRPRMSGLYLKQRFRITYLILCHWMDRAVIDREEVKLVVIGDPSYRTGMMFELCRVLGRRCINAINPDIFQMHKYYEPAEFGRHYRDVPETLLARLAERPDIAGRVREYLQRRFQGAVRQHDALRAYGRDKVISSRERLDADYALDPALPLVFVMAHVFSDAPHSYPGMLYTDYEEWLLHTVRALARNPRVNFLIKEHPTADLYAEANIAGRLLESIGQRHRLLKSDVHTATVLSTADAILTCGGTIGVEASVQGIPAVLAARPPYSGKGFTVEPAGRAAYERLLESGIEALPPLSESQARQAGNVAYAMFELFDNDGHTLETGGVPNVWGQPYDEEAFFRGVAAQSQVPATGQEIYRRLKEFDASPDTSIINYRKLESLVPTP